MNCYCGKPLINPKAKFCSGVCKMRVHRSSKPLTPITKGDAVRDWRDGYEHCAGCNGTDCASGFIPNSPDKKEFLSSRKSFLHTL